MATAFGVGCSIAVARRHVSIRTFLLHVVVNDGKYMREKRAARWNNVMSKHANADTRVVSTVPLLRMSSFHRHVARRFIGRASPLW